jgi:SanA protein
VQARLSLPNPFLGLSPRRVLRAAGASALTLAILVLGANAYMILGNRSAATSAIADLPHAQAAIVPGALVNPDGTMSSMLADRVHRAAALYEAGKVDKVIVSGDHGSWAYDEPDTMRKELVRAGIPERDIFTDHAGFNTHATMVRAREVFGVDSAIVVTQNFHMARSLYLADDAGIDAHGLIADLHGYGNQRVNSEVREVLSRIKALGDASLGTDVLLGPSIPITGDGRASRGPAPPPGTPPAGSPGR